MKYSHFKVFDRGRSEYSYKGREGTIIPPQGKGTCQNAQFSAIFSKSWTRKSAKWIIKNRWKWATYILSQASLVERPRLAQLIIKALEDRSHNGDTVMQSDRNSSKMDLFHKPTTYEQHISSSEPHENDQFSILFLSYWITLYLYRFF